MSAHPAPAQPVDRTIPIRAFGLSLSVFLAITYLLCLALRFVVPDVGTHLPWLQFLPGFDWTPFGILLGLIETSGLRLVRRPRLRRAVQLFYLSPRMRRVEYGQSPNFRRAC